jgi:hypothetical protein
MTMTSAFALLAVAAPFQKPDDVMEQITTTQIESLLKELELKYTTGKDNEGKDSYTLDVGGLKVTLFLYGGEEKSAESLSLSTAWDLENWMGMEKVNEWNMERRWTKAWLDNEKDPFLDSSFDFAGGTTMGGVKNWIGNYFSDVSDFIDVMPDK